MIRIALVLAALSIPSVARGQQVPTEPPPPAEKSPAATEAPAPAQTADPCNAPPTILPQPSRDCPETGRRAVSIRVARIAVEAVLGAGLGAVTGAVGAYGGINIDILSGHEGGAGLSTGTALGYTLGVAPGVWLGGRAMGGDGSFGWTLLGSAVGTGISAGLLAIDHKPPMLAVSATVSIATAIIGYELSSHLRRPKPDSRPAARAQGFVLPAIGPMSVGLVGAF